MSDLQNLNEERVKLIKDAQALLDNGDLTPEKEVEFDAMMADADKMAAKINKADKLNSLRREVETYEMPKIHSNGRPVTSTEARASEDYVEAFWNIMRTKDPSHVMPDIRNVLEVGVTTAGGFLVPTDFEKVLTKARQEVNVIRQLATVITTSSDREIPVWDSYGVASWATESSSYGESDDTFSQKVLSAFKMARMTRVSEELMVDSAFDLNSHLAESFGIGFGKLEEQAFAVGTGTNQPRGLDKDGTAFPLAGAAITSDELIDIYHSLKQPYRPNASFLLNNNTLSAVRKLKDSNGQYYFAPSLIVGMADSILGRPVYLSEYVADIGAATAGVLHFGDFRYYRIGDRTTMTLRRLNELFSANGQFGFLASARVDGLLLLDEAIIRADVP